MDTEHPSRSTHPPWEKIIVGLLIPMVLALVGTVIKLWSDHAVLDALVTYRLAQMERTMDRLTNEVREALNVARWHQQQRGSQP
jgi:hypothetical protein